MTPDEINACLNTLRWSPQTLADALGCDLATVEAWLDGSGKIPPKTKVWLYMLALTHREVDQGRPTTIRGKRLKPKQHDQT